MASESPVNAAGSGTYAISGTKRPGGRTAAHTERIAANAIELMVDGRRHRPGATGKLEGAFS
jgi:hypothetical protein